MPKDKEEILDEEGDDSGEEKIEEEKEEIIEPISDSTGTETPTIIIDGDICPPISSCIAAFRSGT